jgi:hypothetical protein
LSKEYEDMLSSKLNMRLGIGKEFDAKYMGGHKAFPKKTHTKVRIFGDSIEVTNPSLRIPYASMTNIENMDEHKISALRVVLLGIIGILWKKRYLYTVIQYSDGTDDQTIVLDFGKKLDELQPLIYQKMLDSRRS